MTESEEKQQAKASSRNYPAYTTDVQIFPMAIGEYNGGNSHIAIPWKKNGTPWQCLKIPPPGFRAQAADVLPAPFGFPTPFRKARYQIKAGFAERCFFFCGISSRFGRDMLTVLNQQGAVDPDIFIFQSNQLAQQLRKAKRQKEKLLEQDRDDTLSRTRELLEVLAYGPESLDTFHGELFRELVDRIIVESNTRLRFRLVNGLELVEEIERTVR